MRLDDPEQEKSQVLDLRAKLQAARQAKKDSDAQSQGNTAESRITRALTRNLKIEEDDDEDSEDWEESQQCSITKYCSSTLSLFVFKAIMAWFGRVGRQQTNIYICRMMTRRRRRFWALTTTNKRPPVITVREATILSRLAISSTTDTTSSGSWAGVTSVLSGCAGTSRIKSSWL